MTDNLGGQGLAGVELFVKGEQVWFSEVSPRPHDTGLVTLAPSTRASSSCTPAPSWACRWTPALRNPGASAVIYGGVGGGHRVRRRGREAARARHRPAPVRQTREFHQTPHGRGAPMWDGAATLAAARSTAQGLRLVLVKWAASAYQ